MAASGSSLVVFMSCIVAFHTRVVWVTSRMWFVDEMLEFPVRLCFCLALCSEDMGEALLVRCNLRLLLV